MAKTIVSSTAAAEQDASQPRLKTTKPPPGEEPSVVVVVAAREEEGRDDAFPGTTNPSTQEVQEDPQDQQEEEEEEDQRDLLEAFLERIHDEDWSGVHELLEKDPSLSKREVTMVVQGENIKCLPVHLLCAQNSVPVSVVDAIVTLHPASLLSRDDRGGRLPVHIAMVVQKDPSLELCRYLCTARPQALMVQDQEGNLPLHYAALHGSPASLHWLLEADADACAVANTRDRFPLHMLAARCFDTAANHSVALADVERMIAAHPGALRSPDRFGRLPLHLAANIHHTAGRKTGSSSNGPPPHQWQLLQKLIDHAPEALLVEDKAGKTPLECAVKTNKGSSSRRRKNKFQKPNDVVISSLMESTYQEKRRQRGPSFLGRLVYGQLSVPSSKHHRETSTHSSVPASELDEDLYCCYG